MSTFVVAHIWPIELTQNPKPLKDPRLTHIWAKKSSAQAVLRAQSIKNLGAQNADFPEISSISSTISDRMPIMFARLGG